MGLLYTSTKIFHFTDKLDSLPPKSNKILPPLHIRIKPTNVCNHRCSYCAYRQDNMQLGKDMEIKDFIPRDKMMEILQDCVDMGVKAITFSGGGEPFCYPHLEEAARFLADNNISFASLSNGGLLTGSKAELFAKFATWLRISIDGWDAESYSAYRQVSTKEFDKVLNNIKQFKGYQGKCLLGVSLIVDKKNAGHVLGIIEKVKATRADSIKISPCVISNTGKENNDYHRPFFQEVLRQIETAKSKFEDDSFEIYNAYHELDEKFDKKYTWCPYLQILPVIGADQNVYSCQDKAYNLECGLIGSIKDVRFKDFWLNNKDKFFKINPSKQCSHHCVAAAKNDMIFEYLNADKEHLGFV